MLIDFMTHPRGSRNDPECKALALNQVADLLSRWEPVEKELDSS